MSFLDNYEDVAARIQRFWATHPSGKIHTFIVDVDLKAGYILVECKVYKEFEDMEPTAIDYAFGNVATYNVNMKKFFVEDTVTSAIGRAVGLCLGTDKRPTAQNMAQVEHIDAKIVQATADDSYDPWTGMNTVSTLAEAVAVVTDNLGGENLPSCRHGLMRFKTGEKNGKAWGGWFCTSGAKAPDQQCQAIWAVMGSDGKWKAQS